MLGTAISKNLLTLDVYQLILVLAFALTARP